MAHKKTGSIADLKALFEPLKVRAKSHSMCKMWENKFKIQQPELIDGPRKQFQEWDVEQKINESTQIIPGKIHHNFGIYHDEDMTPINRPKKKTKVWNPIVENTKVCTKTTPLIVNKFGCNNEATLTKDSVIKADVNIDQTEEKEKTTEEMMTCAPEYVVPPALPQQPKMDARAYFSDQLIAPKWAIPYDVEGPWSSYSDYVGEGSYPRNCEAFPNASRGTFDAIAIDANTRVILWEKENFEGKVLLDETGPMLINNVLFNSSPQLITDIFQDPEIQQNYPSSVRVWSETNMQLWTTGSVKIVAANA